MFDNSSGRIVGEYVKYNELLIKCVVICDVVFIYYLNVSKCCCCDVIDLFLGIGLGLWSYVIIE